MAKSVLGNDPFQRGAAVRGPAVSPPLPPEPISTRAARPAPTPVPDPPRVADAPPVAKAPPVVEPPPPPPAADRPAALARPSGGFGSAAAAAFSAMRSVLAGALEARPLQHAAAAASGSYRAVMAGMGAGARGPLDEYGQDRSLVGQVAPLAELLYERYWRIQVDGAEQLPSGPALLVANHSGALPYDGPVLAYALGRSRRDLSPRWLVEDAVLRSPFLGTLLNRLGAVRATPENVLRLLGQKHSVIVFPEGLSGMAKEKHERYQLKRFGRGGFAKLALRSGAPIVPVAVVGAEEATPMIAKLPGKLFGVPFVPLTPLGPIPLPSRWQIRFGQPLDLSGYTPDAASDAAVVERIAEQTRAAIQSMLDAAIAARG
jgi:1-acyl-sn-glycerol-3-phosphate acyltransferase